MPNELPEPLQDFARIAPAMFERVDELHRVYLEHRGAGRILPNTLEAMRVELTYHSNAIEGSTLTLRDTQLVIEGREPNSGKSLGEIYEARNHDRALRQIESWTSERRGELSESDILALYSAVMADIDRTNAGQFRGDRVLISGTRFVPPESHKFPILIPRLIELANRPGLHPVFRAAELHYNFVAIHPFGDGNGRTARLLMNYQLLRSGYPLTLIPVERRKEYLEALEDANEGRLEPFASFVRSCVEDSITKLLGVEG